MTRLLKKFILWEYSRETSVYVIFCLLIVGFIFLTPKSWFEKKEQLATRTSRLIVQKKELSSDPEALQRRVRELTGQSDAEIISTREVVGRDGETFYEIDIR